MILGHLLLGLSIFVASAVEMVEALTIILALGVARGWRSVLLGTVAALGCLGIILVVFVLLNVYLDEYSSGMIRPMWTVVGALLLIFGLQWMRKSILRLSGFLPSRDEDEAYKKIANAAKKKRKFTGPIDWYSFVLAFKGVLLEGFEVVFIVITLGAARGEMGLGIFAAVLAFIFVAGLGVVLHKPLSRVPENWMKFTVGLLLMSFGTYFGAEGVGAIWPLGEWALLYLTIIYLAVCLSVVLILDTRHHRKTEGRVSS